MRYTAIAAAALLSLAAVQAQATALYTFSFSNENGGVAGTVSGTIALPDGDGAFSATSLTVTSAPLALDYTLPLDVMAGIVDANSFIVSGGEITSANFQSYNFDASVQYGFTISTANLYFSNSDLTPRSQVESGIGVSDNDSSSLAFSSVAADVPLPAMAPAFLAALGVAAALSRRRTA